MICINLLSCSRISIYRYLHINMTVFGSLSAIIPHIAQKKVECQANNFQKQKELTDPSHLHTHTYKVKKIAIVIPQQIVQIVCKVNVTYIYKYMYVYTHMCMRLCMCKVHFLYCLHEHCCCRIYSHC